MRLKYVFSILIYRDYSMPTLEDVKVLGGIGALCSLISFVPYVGWLISIAGFILVLIAIKYLSDIFHEPQIFTNLIIAIAAYIVGIILFFVIIVGSLLSFIASPPHENSPNLAPLLGIIVAFLAFWAACIVGGVYINRAYGRMAEVTGVELFRTTGLVYLIGSILVIILIGLLFLVIAKILEAVSFFSIKEEAPPPPLPPPVY